MVTGTGTVKVELDALNCDITQLDRYKKEAAIAKVAREISEKAKAEAQTTLEEATRVKAKLTTELQKAKDIFANVQKTRDTAKLERTQLAREVANFKKEKGKFTQQKDKLELEKVSAITESKCKNDLVTHLAYLLESHFFLLPAEIVKEVKGLPEAFGIPFTAKKYDFPVKDEETVDDGTMQEEGLVAP